MKKTIVALVAMAVMAVSANAQSVNDSISSGRVTFEKMSNFLMLTVDQVEPVRTALEQFSATMKNFSQLEADSRDPMGWEKIKTRHMAQMKQLLDARQYEKYANTFNLTAKNTAERMTEK